MGKIDPATVQRRAGSRYPSPHDEPCQAREGELLSDAAGLTQFGVNLMRLEPGAWSSQRHWHSHEDEFVYVLEGELMLVTDAGETVLRAGDCAGFKAGVRDGHHLQNRTGAPATFLNVGARDDRDECEYSDIDMKVGAGRYGGAAKWMRKDGTPY
jgi:uncharacterized cupin superfamily protein